MMTVDRKHPSFDTATSDKKKKKEEEEGGEGGDTVKRRHWVLTPEKRALVKFIVVAGARGPIRGGSKPDTLFPPRIVKIADLYVAFIAAPLVTSVKSNLFRRTRQSLLHASSPLSLSLSSQ